MSDVKTYDVPAGWQAGAYVDDALYQAMYEASVSDPEAFWSEHGRRVAHARAYTRHREAGAGDDLPDG